MSANSFGHIFRFHSFGESHGPGMGVVIDGCPAGIKFDESLMSHQLERRRPGGLLVSARAESDKFEVLSGVYEGKTLGTPIAIFVRNTDVDSRSYQNLSPRRGHSDDVWLEKFGQVDPRGGGRSSGRETISRVMAGAVALMVLRELAPRMIIKAWSSVLGPFQLTSQERAEFLKESRRADDFEARFPSPSRQSAIKEALLKLKEEGNSWGGIAEIVVHSPPKALGQPVFHKLKSDLTCGLMSVGATSAVIVGEGLHNLESNGVTFHAQSTKVYGGIRGGISTGEDIELQVHVKPTSSILDVAKKGRHDPCILIRALPVFESMVAVTICDHLLWSRLDRL